MTNLNVSGPWIPYLVFQISVLCEKIGWLWELKQLQTSSSRLVLTLSRHHSSLSLAFSSGISCQLGLLPRCEWLAWVLSLSDELVCLHRAVRMLTNYFPGIRINDHKLFERARNLHLLILKTYHPAGIYLFKVINGNTRTICKIYPKLTIKTPVLRQMTSSWCLNY